MSNLDRLFLQSFIARAARARQFQLRMDALKDQEQRTMWAFIHDSLRKARAITRNAVEKEIDNEQRRTPS